MVGTSAENATKSVSLDGARRMALKHIEAFVLTFSDQQAFATAAVSSAPAALVQVTESARIHEAGHLRCRSASLVLPLFSFSHIFDLPLISIHCLEGLVECSLLVNQKISLFYLEGEGGGGWV